MRTLIARIGLTLLVSGALLAGAARPAAAHHGTSVNYDFSKTVTIVGTVTEFRWRNPHSALFVDVTDDSGNVTSYAIELPSPTLMSRGELGWTRHTFSPGDHVEFDVHPSRTGAAVAVGGCTDGCRVLVNGAPPKKEY
jgi:Family of unknown function (DUF6152)